MLKITLMGAGGKMGCRITRAIKDNPDYQVSYVEVSDAGIALLKELGVSVTPLEEALVDADVVVLAIPDRLIGKITREIVPQLKSGAIVMGLDPAAAYAGVMPKRPDITYFVTHPCHPPLFGEQSTPEERNDWFGGMAAQDVVNALYQGPEEHYAIAERLAVNMWRPVRNSYRITVEQMAILEPALVETFTLTLIDAMREAYEEVVKMGVPAEAAMAFLMGHLRVEFGIVFGWAGFPVSDGAKYAMTKARELIFKPDWKKNILNLEKIRQTVAEITDSVTK